MLRPFRVFLTATRKILISKNLNGTDRCLRPQNLERLRLTRKILRNKHLARAWRSLPRLLAVAMIGYLSCGRQGQMSHCGKGGLWKSCERGMRPYQSQNPMAHASVMPKLRTSRSLGQPISVVHRRVLCLDPNIHVAYTPRAARPFSPLRSGSPGLFYLQNLPLYQ